MTQDNTTPETNAQDIINRLVRMDYSISRHGFNDELHTDMDLIKMVIKH